jgi:glycosyltransferase involved in cell wall biosynthesis
MRPWLIASGDFTTLGGMDRANHGLAGYLARTGRPVHLVAHRVADDLAALPNLTVHTVPRPLGAHMLGAPLLASAASRQAKALGASACVLANGGNAVLPGATWVHYLHAAHAPTANGSLRTTISSGLGRRYYLARERAAVRTASLVICNSKRTASDVERNYDVDPSRIRVIYYGVDANAFTPASAQERSAARQALGIRDDRRTALFIGALGDRRKGFDVLFDAWRRLAEDPSWDVDLLVAGTGAERDAWVARGRQFGLESRIRFLGFRSDIAGVLAAGDLLVHPTRYEAYGLGVHEAICRGLPAIVTDGTGVAERYPAQLGGLIIPNPPQVDALVSALRAWRRAADQWAVRIAPLAREFRARTWDDMAADIVAAVES